MAQRRDTQTNTKPIDLGKLQDDYNKTSRDFARAKTLLENAQQQFDKANDAYTKARTLLSNAARSALSH